MVVYGIQRDRLNRLLAEVYVDGESKSLNEQLLEKGLAWWWERYSPDNAKFRDLQKQAQESKQGLWSQDNPEPPWEFRVKDRMNLYDKWQKKESDDNSKSSD